MTRKLLLALFCFWLVVSLPTVCSANYQVNEAELTRLEQIFNRLETNNNQLLTALETSKQDLTQAREKLKKYQTDLALLQEDLLKLKAESAQAKTDLETARNSLTKANQSLEQYAKEVKSEIKSLKIQRALGYAAAIAALFIK